MSPLVVGLASLVVATGATLQGSVGFGLGLFSVPILLLIEPRFVPGPLLFASIGLTLLLTHRDRRGVRVADLKWALSGRVVGIAVAAAALVVVPQPRLAILFGALVLLAVGLSATGLHLPVRPGTLFGAGILSGFMGTAVSIGGPPMALLYQRQSGPQVRGTLSAYFVIGVSLSLIGLNLVGRFGVEEFLLALALLPGIGVGFVASRHTARLLNVASLRTAILIVSAVSALVVLLRALL